MLGPSNSSGVTSADQEFAIVKQKAQIMAKTNEPQ
jgi:hypothetical protein